VREADNLITFMCRMAWKSGSLNLLEPYGPHVACCWSPLTFTPSMVAGFFYADAQTDRQTDKTNKIVAFCNFANAPNAHSMRGSSKWKKAMEVTFSSFSKAWH